MSFTFDITKNVVSTTKGKVSGFEVDGLISFYGIPYGKAKRFHKPEEADAWENTFSATTYGYNCPLMDHGLKNAGILTGKRFWSEDEDCLNLNVLTTSLEKKKMPVIVWIHGGGYSFGSSMSSTYVDGNNVAKDNNIVYVGVNHRLNILGYLDVSEFGEEYKYSANVGLFDIILALKWVKENIEAFGGDPNNVTLVGNSGGGGKILALMQMKDADGLYNKAYISSGILTFVEPDAEGSDKELIEEMLKCLNISTVKEMEDVRYIDLVDAYRKASMKVKGSYSPLSIRPKVDNYYPGNVHKVGFNSKNKDVIVLAGNAFTELEPMIPTFNIDIKKQLFLNNKELISAFKESFPERDIKDLFVRDVGFNVGTYAYLKAAVEEGRTVYNYQFDANTSIMGGMPAIHCSDLPYIFHNCNAAPASKSLDNYLQLEEEMNKMFVDFVRSGDPGFEKCDKEHLTTKVFDNNGSHIVKDYAVKLNEEFIKIIKENADKLNKAR